MFSLRYFARRFALPASFCLLLATAGAQAQNAAREATVRCVYYTTGDGPTRGGTAPVTVRVGPNATGMPHVYCPESGGATSGELRSSAWVAAFCASYATNRLISDHEFTVVVREKIEGPSAGLLLAATMIALIRGDAVLPDVTITGAINPDGSAGPIRNAYYKLLGAKGGGIKKFGYPVGSRISTDDQSSEPRDLWDEANKLEIEPVELTDVYDAYRLLTGKVLERPALISESELQISSGQAQALRSGSEAMLRSALGRVQSLEAARNSKSSLAGAIQSAAATAEYCMRLSKQYGREGAFALAYLTAEQADTASRQAEFFSRLTGASMSMEALSAFAAKEDAVADQQLQDVRRQLRGALSRPTVGGKLNTLYVFSIYWQARSFLESARRIRAELASDSGKPRASSTPRSSSAKKGGAKAPEPAAESDEETGALPGLMLQWIAYSQAKAFSAKYWLTSIEDSGAPAKADEEVFRRMGTAYQAAAAAGLDWFRAVAVNPRKNAAEKQERYLMAHHIEYLPSLSIAEIINSSSNAPGDELLPLDLLAAGDFAFHGTAGLINRTYNFPPFRDENNNILREGGGDRRPPLLSNRKALGRALDLARQRVLEECTAVKAQLKFIPDSVKLNYELANAQRDRDDEDRLSALKAYWRCVFFCEVARAISSAAPGRPEPSF